MKTALRSRLLISRLTPCLECALEKKSLDPLISDEDRRAAVISMINRSSTACEPLVVNDLSI